MIYRSIDINYFIPICKFVSTNEQVVSLVLTVSYLLTLIKMVVFCDTVTHLNIRANESFNE